MGNIFFVALYQPLYNLLVICYNLIPAGGVGLAIILVTILIKSLVFPLTFKSMKVQKEMQEIQPKINEIKAKYKDNQEEMAKQLMAVYKVHKVNPFASCLPTILQLVIFITLYRVLSAGIQTVDAANLYPFVHNPGMMAHVFLGMDLTVVSIPLAILSAAMQFVQARQMISKRPPKEARTTAAMDEDMTATMNKMMLTVLPIMMLVLGITTLPGGTTLYIFVSTLLTYILYAIFISPKTKVNEPAEPPKQIS